MAESLHGRLAALPAVDRRLVVAITVAALVALVLGIAGGVLAALARGGFVAVLPDTGYRFLTVHGVSAFFYWLYFAQAALLLAFTAAETQRGLAWRAMAWAGFAAMLAGFLLSLAGAHMGTPLLYDGAPALSAQAPHALVVFNLGYLLLGVGLMVLPGAAIATLIGPRREPSSGGLSGVGFALFAWAGFLAVSGFAALHAFLPGTRWALGLGPFPATHGTDWHILFHNMHYLPLMATVIVWYVLVRALTGVTSVFGERFSKIVFAMYLVFVPPTSLYHMFLEPDLPGVVRVTGSLLSLFVSVPTLTVLLVIVASLEVHARSRGGRGLFGWLRMLPWRHPAMAAIALAVVNVGLGLVLAFVLIQERLAPLLSDTFFVPGYFHFFTVGTVSLTFLAAFAVIGPALTGGALWRPGVLRWSPWLVTVGLMVFGGAGVAAGYLGAPRRVIDIAYRGEAPALWQALMAGVGIGGTVMAVALLAFAAGVAMSLWPRRAGAAIGAGAPTVAWGGTAIRPGASAWVGPATIVLIVAGMYAFTALAFELLRALPISGVGGGGH